MFSLNKVQKYKIFAYENCINTLLLVND